MNKKMICLQERKSIRRNNEDEQLAFDMIDLAKRISACQKENSITSGLTSVSLMVDLRGRRPFYILQLHNIDLFPTLDVLWNFEPDPCEKQHEIYFV